MPYKSKVTATFHFHEAPVPQTYEHERHLIEQLLKYVPTEEYNITTKGKKEVNHIWIEIKN